ncbi:type II secretion system protein N [Thiomicrorhabdus aquaedulcis]|uniref:type II secretion system protein N n=1 Tax=Thiomicrorhabdus aquaedulcis TaxID=2211106 RepID=UPI000FD9BAFA|nr:type II secretion system protein N [Thiomicrorhabdus aquaedulcis]
MSAQSYASSHGKPHAKTFNGMRSKKAFVQGLLLFSVGLVVSVGYHLPAAWVQSTLNLPSAAWQAQSTQGTLWQGQTHLLTLNPRTVVGLVDWQVSPSALFWGDLALRLNVNRENASPGITLKTHASVPLTALFNASNPYSLNVNALNGQIDLTAMYAHLSALGVQVATAKGATRGGTLHFEDMSANVNLPNLWPTQWAGSVRISQLELLGSTMPDLIVTPSIDNDKVVLSLASAQTDSQANSTSNSQSNAWQLSGKIVFTQAHVTSPSITTERSIHYQIDLTLTAQSAQQMPDWASFMNLKSPTVAILSAQGAL